MEHLNISELAAVSRHWTPSHIDVTDAPVVYAKPKPGWLDRWSTMQVMAPIDEADRFRRRMTTDRLVIEPNEIPQLPPLDVAEEPKPLVTRRRWQTVFGRLLVQGVQ